MLAAGQSTSRRSSVASPSTGPQDHRGVERLAVKLVKASGEFVWHQHEIDEVFLVFSGQVTIQLRGTDDVTLGPGQLFVVPRRTEHRPYAPEGCQLMLLEPGVVNTGSAPGELTAVDEWI